MADSERGSMTVQQVEGIGVLVSTRYVNLGAVDKDVALRGGNDELSLEQRVRILLPLLLGTSRVLTSATVIAAPPSGPAGRSLTNSWSPCSRSLVVSSPERRTSYSSTIDTAVRSHCPAPSPSLVRAYMPPVTWIWSVETASASTPKLIAIADG